MLAERRRKQKWSLNPRGTQWSSDSNKFGQRLLEKMGWKTGCGLGVNLQGPTEHVRVSVKNDNRGVGFKGRAEDVLEHQSSFSKLLEELNGGAKEDVKVSSLEQQSQQSRARVHYRKFTRGKDLSRCSDKDLQCILGKNVNDEEEPEQNSFNEQDDQSFGVLSINGGNSDKYFNNKINKKFGFDAEESDIHESKIQEVLIQKSKKNKCKKSKNSSSVSKIGDSKLFVDDFTDHEIFSSNTHDVMNKIKKNKKKLKHGVQNFVNQVVSEQEENQSGDFAVGSNENISTEMLVDVTDGEVLQKKKHKLGKRKDKKQRVCETKLSEDELQDEIAVKKRRKKNSLCSLSVSQEDAIPLVKKLEENCDNEDRIVSETCDVNLDDGVEGVADTYKKKSRKKKRKESQRVHELCQEKELVKGEMLQEKVTTGISKGEDVTDFGFKGSNIMCIKGYGVT